MGGQGTSAASVTGPQHSSLLLLRLAALACPFGRVREEAGCGAGLRGSLLSPKTAYLGASPEALEEM